MYLAIGAGSIPVLFLINDEVPYTRSLYDLLFSDSLVVSRLVVIVHVRKV